MTRRQFVAGAASAGAWAQQPALDRRAIVSRHNPVMRFSDPGAPLSVGNGEFAFTVDVTGLQTLPDLYERRVPLCTQAQWGWHSSPIPDGLSPEQFRLEMFDTYGREAGYATSSRGQERLYNWLRENPHRLNLARIGLSIDGLETNEIARVEQKLDLWTGTIESRFRLRGSPVHVVTCCHPDHDAIGVSIRSPLLAGGRLAVAFDFPYGSPEMNASDWKSPDRHSTRITRQDRQSADVERVLDADRYYVQLRWEVDSRVTQAGAHRVVLSASAQELDFTCSFSPKPAARAPSAGETRDAAAAHWRRFWSTGGAIDFSKSSDRRAGELERRIVLSQYLTAIQCAGSSPPQETGLTCNSWYGKFHLEMHWWHAAHFAMWGRTALLERSLAWYESILPSAREKARQQGYPGVRWPKMTALDGRDSPSPIGPLLIWQQPHPIAFAELCYLANPDRQTLERYSRMVMESAEFMAGFAVLRDGKYMLGPPVIPAQENHPPRETWNPAFELAYWRHGLGIAQKWRERLGMARDAKWDDVCARLAPLPLKSGLYLAHENCPQTFTERNRDHPSMLAALGVLPGEGVDREAMLRTLGLVLRTWKWPDTWGWDFPMAAMTAVRLGEPRLAIEALFIESPKNVWLSNGHNYQRENLPLYLPGNGGLLAAIALMAERDAFSRPAWSVKWENLKPLA